MTIFTIDGFTDFAAFEDVPDDPVAILDRVTELDPEISVDLARAAVQTILIWIRRGAWIDNPELPMHYRCNEVIDLVDGLIPRQVRDEDARQVRLL